ncbi:hypothetical protein ILYODFUR_016673 [Ilyodon furcidens]|uniref:Uncharacterized protein n=1 Tax=Ilyodon furcidens TaxID=33524 RepID=A0ABV0U8N7_9TELE
MDSLQRSISSITQLLQKFASNSATSALPRLRSLAPPTVIHLRNTHPDSSLRVRCITSFSFLNCFLIHMPFRTLCFPLLFYIQVDHILLRILTSHSGSAPESFRGSSLIWFLSLLPSPAVDHCVTSPDGCTAMFESSHPCLSNNLPFGKLVPPLSICFLLLTP